MEAIEPDGCECIRRRHISWDSWGDGSPEIDAFRAAPPRLSHSGAAHWLSRQTQGIGIDANICVCREDTTVRLLEAVRASSNTIGCPAPIP